MNEYYSHAGYPATNASGSSASMRAELDSIAAGFDKLPPLAGNALKTVRVNAAGTALETSNAVSIPVTSMILKGDGAGGLSPASSGIDYAPATSGTALLKGNGSGGFSSAGAVPNGLMKGDGSSVSAASAGTDYLAPAAIGVTVQAYDVDTAKTDVAQNFTAVQTPKTGTASVSTTSDFVFDPSTHGQVCTVTVTNAVTVTIRASSGKFVAGAHYTLILKAGDTSARTYAHNTTEVKAPSQTLPITSGTATNGAWDVLHLVGVDTNTVAVVGSARDVR